MFVFYFTCERAHVKWTAPLWLIYIYIYIVAFFKENSMQVPLDDICSFGICVERLSDQIIPAVASLFQRVTTFSTLCIMLGPSFVPSSKMWEGKMVHEYIYYRPF